MITFKNLNETTLFEIYIVLNFVHYNNIPYLFNQFNIEYFINFIKTNKIAPYKNNILIILNNTLIKLILVLMKIKNFFLKFI